AGRFAKASGNGCRDEVLVPPERSRTNCQSVDRTGRRTARMMSIVYLFWMYVILFAIIGAMRGWAKELLVIFSCITALAVNMLMDKYIPLVRDLPDNSSSVFWIRTIILISLVYFGYQTVAVVPRLASKAARER